MTPFSDYGKVALAAWAGLDTPLSHRMIKLYAEAKWEDLMAIRVSPGDYCDSEMYFRDAQAVALVRKLPVKIGGNPKRAALEKMWQAEKACCVTNARFARYLENGPFESPSELRALSVLERVREKFRRILGPCPDWEKINPKFGPGAVVETVAGRTTALDKISARPTIYPASWFLLDHWSETAWFRSLGYDSMPIVVRGERFATVPKEWDIDRTIGIGASLPVYYQLGVGMHLRTRLRLFGIDLETGQALHRQVACGASRRGDSATVDLVSASDTVARLGVKYFATDEWYQLLDSLRAPMLQVGDKNKSRWYRLERFSSMGNGYTFELQTCLFLAIAMVAAEGAGCDVEVGKTIFVYGDDIIVPTEAYDPLVHLLRFCGFTTNPRKSFGSGPFRESCGGDYWNGEVVRPHFQKELPRDPAGWIALANGLRRAALARWGDLGPLLRAWLVALDRVPSNVRKCRGPVSLGDVVIHDTPSEWSFRIRDGIREFRSWVPVTNPVDLRRYSPDTVYAYALGMYRSCLIPRNGVSGYRQAWVPCAVTSDYTVPKPLKLEGRVVSVPFGLWGSWCPIPRERAA